MPNYEDAIFRLKVETFDFTYLLFQKVLGFKFSSTSILHLQRKFLESKKAKRTDNYDAPSLQKKTV